MTGLPGHGAPAAFSPEKTISIVSDRNLPSLSLPTQASATAMMFPARIARFHSKLLVVALCVIGIGNATGAGFGNAGSTFSRGFSSGNTSSIGAGGESGGDVGLGIFSRFPVRITLSIQGGYDDNIFTTSTVKEGSAFTNGSIGLSYLFGSPRTQIEVRAGGGITYYYDRPQQPGPDYNGFLGVTLQHKFNARLTLDVTSYTTYQSEPDFSLDIGINRRSGDYFYTSDLFNVTYLFSPRFSTVTNYTVATLLYDTSNGSNSFQNRVENTVGNQFRYLILPTTSLIGEYRIQFVTYLDRSDFDSLTHFLLAGFDHTFNPRFNGTFRAGVQLRESEGSASVNSGSGQSSPYFESTVTYVFNQRSDVIWSNRYGIQEGDLSTSQNRTTYHTGLVLRYGLTPRITSRLSAFYEHNSYGSNGGSTGFDEDAIDTSLSLRYAATRYLGFTIGCSRTDVLSGATGRSYSRDRIFGGFDFIF
jgi:Putative beta-barrel porin 2